MYNQHSVSIDIWVSFDMNPNHPQLVLDPMECFHSVFNHHITCTKNWCLNRRLLLGYPSDQSCVCEYKETSPWQTCIIVSGMVAVNLNPEVNAFAPLLQHVSQDHLFQVAMKLNSLVILEDVMIYLRLSRITRQPWFVPNLYHIFTKLFISCFSLAFPTRSKTNK